jgi:exonuclease SbcC
MIPILLQIEGFLSYQSAAVIDFTQIHLACISGLNGSGKSSILDAITWALFGSARSRNDDVINQNSKAASVKLTFEYENLVYRVQRLKELDKSVTLEFSLRDEKENQWKALTEHSSTETQKRIISVLRLDYDTFINASFFLQGKADLFTTLTAAERKEVLASILGLEIWESYRAIAREKHKTLELERKRIIGILDEIESEITQEETIQTQLLHLRDEEKSKNETRAGLSLLYEQAKRNEQAQKNLEQQIKLQENEFQKFLQRLEQKQKQQQGVQNQIQQLQLKVEKENQIETNFFKWKNLRAKLEKWDEKKDKFQLLENQKREYQQQIALQKSQAETQLKSLSQDLFKVEQSRESLPVFTQERDKISEQITFLERQSQMLPEMAAEMESKQGSLVQKKEMLKQLNLKNDELREHLKAFQKAGPECPFCNQPLTQNHRQQYEEHVKKEGLERKDLILAVDKDILALTERITLLKKQIEETQKQDLTRQILEKDKTQRETQIQNLENIIREWEEDKANTFTKLKDTLAEDNLPLEEKAKILAILPKIEKIGYDAQAHLDCKTSENQLRASENEMRELELARSTIQPLQKQTAELEREIAELEKDVNDKRQLIGHLQESIHSESTAALNSNELQQQLDQVQIALNQLNLRIGGEDQKLDNIKKKKISKKNHLESKNSISHSIAQYAKLEEAFGKNGIPAMLIEQALPQIQEHANRLLDRLTNGAMSIQFETQGEYKDKKRQDKKETLEIKINDQNGKTRNYEMFSGGEAFRINFAVRIALSQVLAKRSGAKLQTLVIDEGFGSQDADGRQKLIEVIGQIKDDFAKILIITHLDELKDIFPARIEVEKTNLGSQISVQVS